MSVQLAVVFPRLRAETSRIETARICDGSQGSTVPAKLPFGSADEQIDCNCRSHFHFGCVRVLQPRRTPVPGDGAEVQGNEECHTTIVPRQWHPQAHRTEGVGG